MNTIFKTTMLLMMISIFSFGRVMAGETKEVKIKTSMNCESCEANVKKTLSTDKGIIKWDVDLTTKILTATYDPSKTNPDKIRNGIAKAGYDADNVKADPKAYNKLKPCCKKEN